MKLNRLYGNVEKHKAVFDMSGKPGHTVKTPTTMQ